MLTLANNRWLPRAGTFAVWLLAAGSAVFWGLRVSSAPGGAVVVPLSPSLQAAADPAAVARLLGAVAPAAGAPAMAAPQSSRFTLVGVVASRSYAGAALISVDGKPAKPYRVGAAVDDGLVLQSVAPRRAALGPQVKGPAAFTLEMPLPKR